MRIMLTMTGREEISRGLAEKLSFTDIALRLGCNPSVVSREVARHGGRDHYRAAAADERATAQVTDPSIVLSPSAGLARLLRALWATTRRFGWSGSLRYDAWRRIRLVA